MYFFLLLSCLGSPKDYVRRPCPDAPAWEPNLPVFVSMGTKGRELALNESEASRLTLSKDGVPVDGVPFGFATGMGYCVVGGLVPDADYTWTFAASGTYVQERHVLADGYVGTWAFHTAATSALAAPASVADCRALLDASSLTESICAQFREDTGETGDSAAPPDTGVRR